MTLKSRKHQTYHHISISFQQKKRYTLTTMIWGLLGDVGSGKTLFMAYIGYNSQLTGVEITANFHLHFPYEHIDNIQQLRDLELGPKRLILIDEAWASGMDSRTPMSKTNIIMSKFLLQARKKKADVLHSNQIKRTLDPRLREPTSMFLMPRITLSLIERTGRFTLNAPDADLGIVPYLMNVSFCDRWLNPINYEDVFMVYPCHLLYETNEIINEMKPVDYNKLKDKYWNFKGSKRSLTEILSRDEGVDKKDAAGFVEYLFGLKTNEYLQEIKNNIKK